MNDEKEPVIPIIISGEVTRLVVDNVIKMIDREVVETIKTILKAVLRNQYGMKFVKS